MGRRRKEVKSEEKRGDDSNYKKLGREGEREEDGEKDRKDVGKNRGIQNWEEDRSGPLNDVDGDRRHVENTRRNNKGAEREKEKKRKERTVGQEMFGDNKRVKKKTKKMEKGDDGQRKIPRTKEGIQKNV
ncbi:hypothetical protein FQR65_LT11377 [Abscondita terminalis]|nr:hypothetical protein FQR65_LT11377 [Abscondita terminalis]